MAIRCEVPTDVRKQYGFGEQFLKSLGVGLNLAEEQLQAILKNLGMDDLRAVELRKGKAHMFGKNLADIDYWKGGDVPSGTLVKKQNADGELEYFLSNRKATIEPSKWVLDDGKTIKPNPDWTYVGKNVTINNKGSIQRYSKGKGGVYYPDEAGDVVLKVTKPYNADGSPVISKRQAAERGYDAIDVGEGGYRLVHEPTQAINRNSVLLNESYDSTTYKKTEPITKEEVTEPEVVQRVKNYELSKGLLYGGAGYVTGEIADNWLDTENLGWAGGAIGMMLGTPKVRSTVRGVLPGKAGNFAEQARDLSQKEIAHQQWREAYNDGYRGDPSDTDAINAYRTEVMSRKDKLKNLGKQVWTTMFDNDLFGSALGRLQRIGGEQIARFTKIMRGLETHHTSLIRDHYQIVEETFGRQITDREFKNMQRDFVRGYIDENNLRNFENLTDEELDEFWGGAVRRIITFGAKIDEDGTFRFSDDMKAAGQEYSSDINREIDSFFLRDPQAAQAIEAWTKTFDKYGNDAIKTYRQSILKTINSPDLNTQQGRLLLNILDSELSFNQWLENIPAGFAKTYKESLDNEVFKEAIGYVERINKIQALEGQYIPQMVDPKKEQRVQRRVIDEFVQRNPNATEKDKYDAWRNYRINQILAHNKEGYKALRVSASGDNIEPILKRNEMDLVNELKNHLVYNISNPAVREMVVEDLQNIGPRTVEKYIGRTMRGGKPMYYLKDPQIKLPDGTTYDLLSDLNRGVLDQADRTYMNVTTALQSDHLDNPRNFIMPTSMVQTDLDKVMRSYAIDAGNKLYLVENGFDTTRKVNRFLDETKKELEGKGYDALRISRDLGTVRSWYQNITNTADAIDLTKNPDEILNRHRRKAKTRKVLETLGNFGYMPFLWFTSFYSAFQPFITGPYLASHGNVWKSYKQMFRNPEEFKNATDNLRKMGIIQDKARSFSPEVDFGADIYSDGGLLDWFHGISKKGVNFSANFSITKKILEHPSIGVDVDRGGFLRFFGGSMLDISGAESALTTMSVLREVEDMVDAYKQFLDDPDLRQATGGGKTYRRGQIRQRLEELGIENVDRFVRESSEVNSTVGENQIRSFRQHITGKADATSSMPESLMRDYNKLADTVVNQLHGRSKMSRPLWWTNNPYGRLLSQFSVYSQNFAIQTIGQRISYPIRRWFDEYQIPENESVFKVALAMRNGDDEYIKGVFGDRWREAYDDFPVDAINNLFKVTPIVMGTGAAMMATRDTVTDFITLLGNEAIGYDDYTEWERTKENYGYLSNLFDDDDVALSAITAARSALHNAVDMGYGGRLSQLMINESRYTQGGLWSKTPVTGMINDAWEMATTPIRSDVGDMLPQTAKSVTDNLLLRTPIIGSFHGLRSGLVNTVFNQPKNRDVSFTDNDTGMQLSEMQIFLD